MKLVQAFARAVMRNENWYLENGIAKLNWNFVDADCYMECGNDYPDADSFYDEWNTLCDIYCYDMAAHVDQMTRVLMVDRHAA